MQNKPHILVSESGPFSSFWLVGWGGGVHALRIIIIIGQESISVRLIKTRLTTGFLYTHGICGSHIYIVYTLLYHNTQ